MKRKRKQNENNALQPITTISIDHMLSKIDLKIEHVLIGVEIAVNVWSQKSESFSHDAHSESRFRFSNPKTGASFRPHTLTHTDLGSKHIMISCFRNSLKKNPSANRFTYNTRHLNTATRKLHFHVTHIRRQSADDSPFSSLFVALFSGVAKQ